MEEANVEASLLCYRIACRHVLGDDPPRESLPVNSYAEIIE